MSDTPETDAMALSDSRTDHNWRQLCRRLERERDEATRSLEKEKIAINYFIQRGMRERDEASQQIEKLRNIAERAIDDLAWFNETNAQRLRAELDQFKERAK